MTRRPAIWLIEGVVALAAIGSTLGGATVSAAADASDALAAKVREAKQQFRPLTDADVAARRADVLAALDRLEKRLGQDGENGQRWQRYLKIDQLREELARPKPDAAAIAKAYQRFTAGHDGLWLVWFADVRQSLMRYLQTTNSVAATDLRASYEDTLEKLATRLQAYQAKPTPEDAWQIGLTLRLLGDIDQAPELIAAIRQQFASSNLQIQVSRDLLARNIEGAVVNEPTAVRDCILGSTVVGTGITNGQKRLELWPSEHYAVIDTVFRGTTTTNTTAYNRSVQVYSLGNTQLSATKRLWYTADGVGEHAPRADATTHTQFQGLSAPCRLVEKVAWRRAYEQKSEAEWIAARRAEAQLRQRVDQEGSGMIGQLRDGFETRFRRPLTEYGVFPESLRFSTTREVMRIVALQAAPYQLAAAAAPPDAPAGADLVVRVHESMITNMADRMLGGMTLREEGLEAAAKRLAPEAAERKRDADEGTVAIAFPASMAPATVTFADDTLSILIRGERIYKNDELISRRLRMVDITVQYRIERTPQGVKLVRQGAVEVLPTGHEAGKPLSAEVVVVRNALMTKLDEAFRTEWPLLIDLDATRGPGGQLTPVAAEARNGWLVIGWQVRDKPAVVAAK